MAKMSATVKAAYIAGAAAIIAALVAGVFSWVGPKPAPPPSVQASEGGVAAGGDIEASTITITVPDPNKASPKTDGKK